MNDPTITPMEKGRLLADRYELIGHIARGGMADVWEARDTMLGRKVAVKVLHSQFSSDASFVTRFRREAQAAANLSHPNIVSIFDWGEEGALYFIVMELIEGRSLRDVLRSEGRLLPRRAAEIAAEVAAALAVSHRAGLVHRDIKPGNILITGDGTVKVTDFGIARAWNDSEELTRTGAVIGTATYFSPEQAQGEPADERSDIYSLGVVLYEMLVGRPPFKGDSPVSVAYQHVQEPALLPSADNPDVPPHLERIVMRAMDKVPELRYQSAMDLRGDLLRTLRGDEPMAAAVPVAEAPTQLLQEMPAPTVTPEETYRQVAAERDSSQLPFFITAAVLIATLAALLFVILGPGFGGSGDQGALIPVPDVIGMERDEALLVLQNLGLKVNLTNTADLEVLAGIVISTNPEAGTELREGDFVNLFVSTGPQDVTVPSVVGETVEDATTLLEGEGLVVGEIVLEPSDEIEEGLVISQAPAAGTTQAPGTEVTLTVSAGPDTVVLEDLRGRSVRDATAVLTSLGLTVDLIEEFDNTVPIGSIIRTEPGPGDVPIESTVLLVVSKGPEPVAVPNLIGLTEAAARAQVEALGLVLRVSSQVNAGPDLAGLVAEQSPRPETLLAPGEVVSVNIGAAVETTTTTTTTTTPPPTTTTLPAG